MRVEDVVDCAAVAGDVAVFDEVEGVAEEGLQEEGVGAAGDAVDGVVGAHHAVDFGVSRGDEELGSVVFGQVLLGDLHVVTEPGVVVPVLDIVAGVVLRCCDEFERVGVDAALDAGDVFVCVGGGEAVGVFAWGFLAAAPNWVAEGIDVGRVDVESVAAGVHEGTALRGDDGGDLVN